MAISVPLHLLGLQDLMRLELHQRVLGGGLDVFDDVGALTGILVGGVLLGGLTHVSRAGN